ncbi:hypothetical protein [Argonema antarcticum]|uniref:hypothetical protein n=1 Tax=Argonema antarcticum TaxID=2942763 RepID=UPI00201241A5|nr:hypothetical protein [Argonema antarcticum]MCL1470471.1 hypothetical protein [Argonema antarcticum A004/B2]
MNLLALRQWGGGKGEGVRALSVAAFRRCWMNDRVTAVRSRDKATGSEKFWRLPQIVVRMVRPVQKSDFKSQRRLGFQTQ